MDVLTVDRELLRLEPKDYARPTGEIDHAIRQIVTQAVVSDEVIDIFSAAGLKSPDISILSDQFLAEIRGMQHKNLAVELLRKLLSDEVKARSRHNLVESRSFAEMLEKSVRRYQSRAIEAAQVIEELIELAREMREAQRRRGQSLGLSKDELAFYDALEVNDSAEKTPRRRHAEDDRLGAGRDRPERRDDRLDGEGVGAGQTARHREAHPAEAWVPAGQAGGGDEHGAAAGGAVVGVLPSGLASD